MIFLMLVGFLIVVICLVSWCWMVIECLLRMVKVF